MTGMPSDGDAGWWGCQVVGMPGGGAADGSGTTPWALLIYIINSFFFFLLPEATSLTKVVCLYKNIQRGFPGGPVDKTQPSFEGGAGLIPG